MLIRVPDFVGPVSWPFSDAEGNPVLWGNVRFYMLPNKEPQPAQEQLVASVLGRFRTAVARQCGPKSAEGLSLRIEKGKLIAMQTACGHKAIEKTLDDFAKEEVQISVEVRFVRVSAEQDAKLLQWLESQNLPHAAVNSGSILNDAQVDKVLESTQADQTTRSLTAPRVTLFNGQTAYVTVGGAKREFNVPEKRKSEKVVVTAVEGNAVIVTARASEDRKTAELRVIPSMVHVASETQEPVFSGALIDVNIYLQSCLSVLFRLPYAKHHIDGVERELRGPKTYYRLLTSPEERGTSEWVYVLVRPTIILPAKDEENSYPPPVDTRP